MGDAAFAVNAVLGRSRPLSERQAGSVVAEVSAE